MGLWKKVFLEDKKKDLSELSKIGRRFCTGAIHGIRGRMK